MNTYAKKLWSDGMEEQALFVYILNTKLFPYDPRPLESLVTFYYKNQNKQELIHTLEMLISLQSDNELVKNIIQKGLVLE